ncbi:MAG TPA: hypothetical protein VKA91_11995 [Nitrososphaeraceae archaeon]|nr:hypothetical protein [Nitrososphaeraceae archaeon]
MSYGRNYKYIRHYLIAFFSTTLLIISVLALQIQLTDAGTNSQYASGTEPGYRLTVIVTSHPFGTSAVEISITTENGHYDYKKVSTAGGASWTFNVPSNQGRSVEVCVDAGMLYFEQCRRFIAQGQDMTVSLSAGG